jgi:hypothetical protein
MVMELVSLVMETISLTMEIIFMVMETVSMVMGMIFMVVEMYSLVMEMAATPVISSHRMDVFIRHNRQNILQTKALNG